ncbi:hypothetical protein FQA39_LY08016 [Lamprigera yunnana]|nr:hypothetical protein FQA39_LY08016 [Lamprigera yunnana]
MEVIDGSVVRVGNAKKFCERKHHSLSVIVKPLDETGSLRVLISHKTMCRFSPKALTSNKYTVYNPIWKQENSSTEIKFIIELSTVTNVFEPIEVPFMSTKKQGKRAAALCACKILNEKGELDDELQPKP